MKFEDLERYLDILATKDIDPVKSLEEKELLYFIQKSVKELRPVDKKVITSRYWKKQALRDIADRLGRSTEEVVFIEARAINKLGDKIKAFIRDNGYII